MWSADTNLIVSVELLLHAVSWKGEKKNERVKLTLTASANVSAYLIRGDCDNKYTLAGARNNNNNDLLKMHVQVSGMGARH